MDASELQMPCAEVGQLGGSGRAAPLHPTKSGAGASVFSPEPYSTCLISPVPKVRMAGSQDTPFLHSRNSFYSFSENRSTCPQLESITSLLEEPWGLQLQAGCHSRNPALVVGWAMLVSDKRCTYLPCFCPGQAVGLLCRRYSSFHATASTMFPKQAPASGPLHCSST